MLDPSRIEQFARQVQDSIPKGVRDLGGEIEKKIRQVLQAQLAKLELVNRQEFDLQTQRLDQLSEQLAQLEQRVNCLEAQENLGSADDYDRVR